MAKKKAQKKKSTARKPPVPDRPKEFLDLIAPASVKFNTDHYMHVIFLLLCVPIIHFIPYQVYNAMYPLFISVGAAFGIGSIAIIAPFVCNLALATSVTPLNSATYVGCTLCDIDVDHFCNWGGVIMFVSNALVVLVAVLTGVLQL